MKAMLLAAGRGERLRPLTDQVPKAAVPVLGRPVAVQILHRMALQGIREAVVNAHHLAPELEQALGRAEDLGLVSLVVSREESLLGTAGGLRKAAPWLEGPDPVLVHNADVLLDLDYGELEAWHRASPYAATLVVRPWEPGYSRLDVDARGAVRALARSLGAGDEAGSFLYTGCMVLDADLLERLPRETPSDLVEALFVPLMDSGRLGAYVTEGFWREIGTPDRLLQAQLDLIRAETELRERVAHGDPVRELDEARVAVGPGADFHQGVALEGAVALGLATHVGEGSRIVDSVVMSEVWIGPGSTLEHALVAPGTELPSVFEARDVMVGELDRLEPPLRERLPDGVERDESCGLWLRPLHGAG